MTTSGRENFPRNGRGKFVRTLEAAERDGAACRLRAQGWRLAEIAEELGYASAGNAHRGIQRALAEGANRHGAAELRELQITELEELRRVAWQVIQNPPPAFDRLGHIVHDDDGQPVPDPQAFGAAGGIVLRAAERLGRLKGLDAPRTSVTLTTDLVQARIAELRSELGIPADVDVLDFLRTAMADPRPVLQGSAEPADAPE